MKEKSTADKNKLKGLEIATIGVVGVFLGAGLVFAELVAFGKFIVYISFPLGFYGFYISITAFFKK